MRGKRALRGLYATWCFALLAAGSTSIQAAEPKISTTPLGEGLFMLQGKGGNIGLSVGEDGAFLIDDDYAPLTPAIRKAIAERTDESVRFVVNTHWHADHTGGNENFGEAGATIVAHEHVRERLSSEQRIQALGKTVPATDPTGLPVITFERGLTFHLNGETIEIVHVDPAHTDGDAFVHFKGANVIHAGDVFFNGFYPFIDTSSGGRIDGMIVAADRILGRADSETKIVPGHGPLGDRTDLKAYRDMLVAVRDRVAKLVDAGKDRDAVIAAQPTAAFDPEWGDGFLPPDKWVGIVYDSMP